MSKVSRADVVEAIAAKTEQPKAVVDRILGATIDTIVSKVAQGSEVTLVGFGTFKQQHRAARAGRNPQTGLPIQIAAATVPVFKAGKGFKDTVKGAV